MRPLLPRLLLAVIVLGALSACSAPAPAPAQPTAATQATAAPAATEAPAATTTTTAATATTAPTATTAATATTAPTATTEPSPTPAAADTSDAPEAQGALDLLMQAGKAQLEQKAFRATLTTTDPDGNETTAVLEYVNSNNYRLVAEGQEIIIVSEGTFMKQGDGAWEKSPIDMQGMMSEIMSQQGIDALIKDVDYQDIKLIGADTIDGKAMWVYQYTSSMDVGGTTVEAESKNWIGVADKLPYRIEAISDAGDGAKATVVGIYEYDADIKIEAPAMTG